MIRGRFSPLLSRLQDSRRTQYACSSRLRRGGAVIGRLVPRKIEFDRIVDLVSFRATYDLYPLRAVSFDRHMPVLQFDL